MPKDWWRPDRQKLAAWRGATPHQPTIERAQALLDGKEEIFYALWDIYRDLYVHGDARMAEDPGAVLIDRQSSSEDNLKNVQAQAEKLGLAVKLEEKQFVLQREEFVGAVERARAELGGFFEWYVKLDGHKQADVKRVLLSGAGNIGAEALSTIPGMLGENWATTTLERLDSPQVDVVRPDKGRQEWLKGFSLSGSGDKAVLKREFLAESLTGGGAGGLDSFLNKVVYDFFGEVARVALKDYALMREGKGPKELKIRADKHIGGDVIVKFAPHSDNERNAGVTVSVTPTQYMVLCAVHRVDAMKKLPKAEYGEEWNKIKAEYQEQQPSVERG